MERTPGGTGAGVSLGFGASNNIVGTNADGVSDALEANTISGNNGGVAIGRINTVGNRVMGNFIGTDPTGTVSLPNLNDGVTISGIDVGPAGPSGNVIGTNGDGVNDAIEGNVISGNAGLGVRLSVNAFNNRVAGNRIGVDVTGAVAMGNVFRAISIESGANGNIIGTNGDGTSDALEGNVISATTTTVVGFGQGISVAGAATVNNWIAGNRIGTNAAGTVAFPNVAGGVQIASGTKNNVVGTNGDGISDALEANVISGNTSFGVRLVSTDTTGNRVAGNFIGTSAAGGSALPNTGSGVLIDTGAASNVVGTNADGSAGDSAEGNVIAGNTTYGVRIVNTGTNGNAVAGNWIGTNPGGADLGNGSHGIFMQDGAANNVVGGAAPRGNVIAFNGKGVVVGVGPADTPTANTVSRNSIFLNDGLGIDLGDDGVTLNDATDVDGGPNGLLNIPVVESIAIVGASLEISGFTRPGSTIELFIANPDPTGFGEGQTYLVTLVEDSGADVDGGTGSYGPGPVNGVVVGSDNTNRFRFAVPLALLPGVGNGTALTMTATLNGSTSEFSPVSILQAAADLSLTKAGPLLVQPGTTITYTMVVSNAGPGDATGVVLDDPTPTGLTFVSSSALCVSFPCAVPVIPSGSSVTISAVFSVPAGFSAASIFNAANVNGSGPDDPKRHATVTTRVASADSSAS